MKSVALIIGLIATMTSAYIGPLNQSNKLTAVDQELTILINSGISVDNAIELEQLRSKARSITSQIHVNKCASNLFAPKNSECQSIYQQYSALMKTYTKVANKIFTTKLAMLVNAKTWKDSVQNCVESMGMFLNKDMLPDALYAVKLAIDVQPFDDVSSIVAYKFSKADPRPFGFWNGTGRGRYNTREYNYLKNVIDPWHAKCSPVIKLRYTVPSKGYYRGFIHPYFMKTAQEYWKDTPFRIGTTYGSSKHNGIRIGIKEIPKYKVITKAGDSVVDEFIVTWDTNKFRRLTRGSDVVEYIYVDNLPRSEVRWELGGPDRHTIKRMLLSVDGKVTMERSKLLPIDNLSISVVAID